LLLDNGGFPSSAMNIADAEEIKPSFCVAKVQQAIFHKDNRLHQKE
jgi:hypothetical protein